MVGNGGRKKGVKRACGRLETVFVGIYYKTYPMDFRVCNALKIKPFQVLLRNIPFCSLGEVGGAGAEPPHNLPIAAEVVQTVWIVKTDIKR